MNKTVIVVQARLGSTRLPGKVLLPLGGIPVLRHVLERCRRSGADEVVAAVPEAAADDRLAAWCVESGYALFRGSEADVLSRYVGAARQANAGVVVRVTSDCPAVDPPTIDRVVAALMETGHDYVSAKAEESFADALPRGLNVEALRIETLERIHREATDPRHREHVTLMAKEDPSFSVLRLPAPSGLARPNYRLTLDTPDDLRMLRRFFDGCPVTIETGLTEMIRFLDGHPEIVAINSHVRQKRT